MLQQHGLGFGLSSAPFVTNARTRSISAENVNGEKGQGGKEASNLGIGRKGRPAITLGQGEEVTLAHIQGTGVIQHFWITVADKTGRGHAAQYVLRDLILRMYWDDETSPSVDVPLGDFFCNGFGVRASVHSLPIAVVPTGGMNCYISMPFRKSAKITIVNQHAANIDGFFYTFNYSLVDELPENAAYFHAQWRREKVTEIGKDYTILDNVKGAGQYIGTYLAWAALERNWWGEGEIKFYMDGDQDWPTICGTGTEDYVGGAWCFSNTRTNEPESYSTAYLGYKFYKETTEVDPWYGHNVPMHGMYRWHLPDPIRFENDLRVTIQQIGHDHTKLFERSDDISSVAYWYQMEPHAPFPQMPPANERWPR
ncbi:glycoside hydrolase family 172 protein [Paenibacillus sp. TAF43_2]|uniref:glycoside hydrolase family 172 protein n=1 Tax=Paenibacillus sp. TAF43_2 TaxID=3233069 RepID=UPI003F9DB286